MKAAAPAQKKCDTFALPLSNVVHTLECLSLTHGSAPLEHIPHISELERYPLIAYIRAPGTTSSKIFSYLHRCSPYGSTINLHAGASALAVTRKCDWIIFESPQPEVDRSIAEISRPVNYFAYVEEPLEHVIAVLNELYVQAKLLESKRESLDAFQRDVLLLGSASESDIIGFLNCYDDQIFNLQTAFIIGNFEKIDDDELIARLGCYNSIVLSKDIDMLLEAFAFTVPAPAVPISAGLSNQFGALIRKNRAVLDFIVCQSSQDYKLFEAVRGLSKRSNISRQERPSFLASGYFSNENFSEWMYLDSNPDIAEAVVSGSLPAGKTHFLKHGYRENRQRRLKFTPIEKARPIDASRSLLSEAAERYISKLHALRARDDASALHQSNDPHRDK